MLYGVNEHWPNLLTRARTLKHSKDCDSTCRKSRLPAALLQRLPRKGCELPTAHFRQQQVCLVLFSVCDQLRTRRKWKNWYTCTGRGSGWTECIFLCVSLRVRVHEDALCPRASHAKLRELEEGVSEENWRTGSDNVAAARRPAWKQHLREGHSRRRFQKGIRRKG